MTFKKPKTKFVYVILVTERIARLAALRGSLAGEFMVGHSVAVRVVEQPHPEGFSMHGLVRSGHDEAVNLARSIELAASAHFAEVTPVAVVRVPDYAVKGGSLVVHSDKARFIFSFDPFNYKEVASVQEL